MWNVLMKRNVKAITMHVLPEIINEDCSTYPTPEGENMIMPER